MPYKTTAKDFALFKRECKWWIERFGLADWDVMWSHEQDDPGTMANCRSDYAMQATITLNAVWEATRPTEKEIKLTAKHEAMELLLAPLAILANARYVDRDSIPRESHAIINRLMRVLK